MSLSDEPLHEIARLFRAGGERTYGEGVSMREHMLQSAALAVRDGRKDFMVIACLLHDIGHFLHEDEEDAAEQGRNTRHEYLGADYLSRYFPDQVSEPVRLHVAAKRYLYTTESDYARNLSDASRLSLKLQGGAMNADEMREFRKHEFFQDALDLRRYDEDGKVHGLHIAPLEDYLQLMEKSRLSR